MRLIAIDPGVHGLGVAEFEGTTPTFIGYLAHESEAGAYRTACRFAAPSTSCVIEWPQVYSRGRKGDQDDLLRLAAIVGAVLVAPWRHATRIRPRAWKGTVPGDVMTERLADRAREMGVIVQAPDFLAHNALDAFGLGLWYLGKLSRAFDKIDREHRGR